MRLKRIYTLSEEKVEKSYLEAVNEAISEEIASDENVIFFGEDIGIYGGAFGASRGLWEKYGKKRIIETPISENSFVGIAIGAALTGLKPIVEIMFMDFITLAMDQIVNHGTKLRYMYGGQVSVPIVIRTPGGGGRRYGSSHSQSLEGWFMRVPGLKIATPSNPNDAKWMLRYAVQDNNPWLIVESKKLYSMKGEIKDKIELPVGKAKIVVEGSDCTIITYSRMVEESLKAAAELKKENALSIEVIDLRTLSPLDIDSVQASIEKTGKAVVVEEGVRTCGIGAEISARISETCFESMKKPVLRIAAEEVPVPMSPTLEDAVLPDAKKIKTQILSFLGK